jgi:hypothetical protein
MAKFTQRIPGGCDIRTNKVEFEFDTEQDLAEHEYIKRYTNLKGFKRLSKTREDDQILIMAEYDEKRWWVLGYVNDETNLNLPNWRYPR